MTLARHTAHAELAHFGVGNVHGHVLELGRETGKDQTGLDRVTKAQTAWALALLGLWSRPEANR